MHNRRQTGLGEHDVSRTARSIRRAFDSNTDVGLGERGGVIGTIASHRAQVSESLKRLDNLVLVLGEHTREPVRFQDHLLERQVLATGGRSFLEYMGGKHVITEPETAASLLCDRKLVASDHLNLDTERERIVDRLLGIFTRRIEDGKQTDELKAISVGLGVISVELFIGNSESTKTTTGILYDVGLKCVLELVRLITRAEIDDGMGHTLGDTLKTARRFLEVGDLGTFVDGVEGFKLEELNASTGAFGVVEGTNNAAVNGVLVLCTRRIGREQDDVICGEGAVRLDERFVNGKFVGGEGAGLVGAEDGNACKFLDSGDTGDDGLVLRKLLSTDGKSDGQDCGHRDGDTTDEQDEDVVETVAV